MSTSIPPPAPDGWDATSAWQGAPPWGGSAPTPWQAGTQAPRRGIMALHPLSIGELFEATFRAVRANPPVMFAFSVAVMAVASLASSLVQGLTLPHWIVFLEPPSPTGGPTSPTGALSALAVVAVWPALLIAVSSTVLAGMLAPTVADAVVGTTTTMGRAWSRIRARLPVLVGVAVLIDLIQIVLAGAVVSISAIPLAASLAGVSSGPSVSALALAVLGLFLGIVTALVVQLLAVFAPIIVVLEGAGPVHALARSWALARRAFWRIAGRLVLITLLTSTATGVVSSAVGAIGALVVTLASPAVGLVLTSFFSGLASGFVVPVSASFTTLMYTDERIRQEDLAPALEAAATP